MTHPVSGRSCASVPTECSSPLFLSTECLSVCECASAALSNRCVFVCVSVSVCVNEGESDMRMRERVTTLMLLVRVCYESTRCVLTC